MGTLFGHNVTGKSVLHSNIDKNSKVIKTHSYKLTNEVLTTDSDIMGLDLYDCGLSLISINKGRYNGDRESLNVTEHNIGIVFIDSILHHNSDIFEYLDKLIFKYNITVIRWGRISRTFNTNYEMINGDNEPKYSDYAPHHMGIYFKPDKDIKLLWDDFTDYLNDVTTRNEKIVKEDQVRVQSIIESNDNEVKLLNDVIELFND